MAFRGSEIRLILGIQSYGTQNVARLRRDITSLGRTVDLAQANQNRVAAQAARSMEKEANIRDRMARKAASVDTQMRAAQQARATGLGRTARANARLAAREDALAAQAAAKRLQIRGTEAALAKGTSGSAALRQQIAGMNIDKQVARIADKRISLVEREAGLQAQVRRNRATELGLVRQLEAMGAKSQQIQRWRQADANLGSMRSKMKEVVLRLQAADITAGRLKSTLAGVAAEEAIINKEASTLTVQQQKVLASIQEQVGAMGRLGELHQVQVGQLKAIEMRQGAIRAELDTIANEERRINHTHATRITQLQIERDLLQAEAVALAEQEAITKRLLGEEMARARAADQRAVRMQKLQRAEVVGRTVAHVGRTAQFGGLIGIAGLAAAGSAAAEMSRKTSLAGTQMRDVGGTFDQAGARGQALEKRILSMMETFPAGADEMADSAYEIFSSMNLVENGVVNVAKGYGLMATANKAAVAGQVDLEEATSAMITVLNNFDPELQNVNQTMNQVFSIVRFGQMRLSDFAAAMVPLAPVAKTVGLSLIDVGAALATLTILMKSPQQAAQGLARAIELLQLQPFQKGLHAAGVEVTDLATNRMRPLHDIVTDIANTFPEVTTSQRSMVDLLTRISQKSGMTKAGIQGTVQARRALAGLITSMKLYDNILNNIKGSQDEFNQAFNAMKDTPGVQWAIFTNQMKAFALTIGQAALPYLLQLGQKLVDVAHWVEDLIKKTDGAAVKWAVYGAALLLVGGTIMNMVGSLFALAANMRIAMVGMQGMGMAAEGAAASGGKLAMMMRGLMGIGIISIPIVLQLIKGGEPGLWNLLAAAAAGAAGGFMIGGPVGAAIGALTVPLAVTVIAHFQKDKQAKTGLQIEWKKYQDSLGSNFRWFWEEDDAMTFDQFKANYEKKIAQGAKVKIPRIGEDVAQKTKAQLAKPKTLMEQYEDYVRAFTKAQIAAQNAWFDQGESKADSAARLAKARAKVVSQAWENMQQKIDAAVDKLGGVYDKFLDQNKSTFGELGKGPMLSGFMGDIFRGLNDLLMQFGESVAIPPSLINRDLEIQMKNFAKIREGYAQLIKRGVPAEVVQQIQAMGMDALPFVQGLLQMSGPMFNKWKSDVQKSHDDLVKATDIDFDAQLKIWKKYGSDIATKMMEGLSSDAAQKVLEEGFRANVIDLFGKVFREEMAAEIAAGLKEIAEGEAARIAAEKQAKKAAQAAAAAQGPPPLKDKKPGLIDPKTGEAADRAGTAAGRDPRTGISHTTEPGSSVPKSVGAVEAGRQTPGIVVHHHGDTNTIHADGVHPAKVSQALNKQAWMKRNKKRPF